MYSIYILDILFSHKEGDYFICRKTIELYSIILSEIRGKKINIACFASYVDP